MCTLMQKDALLELLASTQAFLINQDFPQRVAEEDELCDLRDYLYSTDPENIDLDRIVQQIRVIENKYEVQHYG